MGMLGILLGTKGSSKKKNNNVVNHNVNAILQIEVVFSFMITVSWAFAVSYITGVHGPGTNIGNLYYFTWISFFSALIILFNCLSHMKPEEEEEGNNDNNTGNLTGVEESVTKNKNKEQKEKKQSEEEEGNNNNNTGNVTGVEENVTKNKNKEQKEKKQ